MDIEEILKSKETIDQNIEKIKEYIGEAKLNGDWAEVKRLQTMMLELDPNNMTSIQELIEAEKN